MPTARPSISARVGVADEIVVTAESDSTPATPMPTPSSAVRIGMPAASSEPKVTTSTTSATTRPSSSVGPISRAGRGERVAADGDLEVRSLRRPPRASWESVDAAFLRALPRSTPNSTVASAARPSGADRLAVERAGPLRLLPAATARASATTLARWRPRTAGSATVATVGRDEHDLGAGAGRAGGDLGQLVEGVLGLLIRDGEPVVERAAQRDEQRDDGAEDRQPGDRDQPAVPVGGAAEPREESAHGKRGLRRISRWWRNAAGGGARCVIGNIGATAQDTGIYVTLDAVGGTKLGYVNTSSSRRFKEGIKPMGAASEGLFALKPVNFRYKPGFDPDRSERFGLIAEDVEKVNPTLVAHDDKGNLTTVRYEAVNVMLLNEFLKEHRAFLKEQRKVEEQGRKARDRKEPSGN